MSILGSVCVSRCLKELVERTKNMAGVSKELLRP